MSFNKKVHQIWLGGNPPDIIRSLQKTVELHSTGWTYKLWTEADFETKGGNLIDEAKRYIAEKNYTRAADILRYQILAMEGGMYIDSDFEAVRHFDGFLAEHGHALGKYEIIAANNSGRSDGAVIYVNEIPHDTLLRMGTMVAFPNPNLKYPYEMVRAANHAFMEKIYLPPRAVFFPYRPGGMPPLVVPPETIAIHHWMSSAPPAEHFASIFKRNIPFIKDILSKRNPGIVVEKQATVHGLPSYEVAGRRFLVPYKCGFTAFNESSETKEVPVREGAILMYRNPVRRMVSAYRDIFHKRQMDKEWGEKAFLTPVNVAKFFGVPREKLSEITFSQFVARLPEIVKSGLDPHFYPIFHWGVGSMQISAICDMDENSMELKALLKNKPDKINSSAETGVKIVPSEEDIAIINEVFASDLRLYQNTKKVKLVIDFEERK